MNIKTKNKVIDAVTLICLLGMFLFAHGYKMWCTAATIAFGTVALILQNCVKYKEEEGDEFDFK